MKKFVLGFAWLFMSTAAWGEMAPKGDINPKSYLLEKGIQQPTVKTDLRSRIVYSGGVRHLQIQTQDGTIMVPYTSPLDAQHIREHSRCVEDSGTQAIEAPVVEHRTELEADVKLFTALLAEQTKIKCRTFDFTARPLPPEPNFDIGVTFPNSSGKPGETKIFNRNLQPNIYIQRDF